mmetsp:Transcript_6928/g.9833  ORF Transcript_6928/g.9833 Transcript_6928/m.9833 type:complete len:96 (-) Transcript_6928:112-399(-)
MLVNDDPAGPRVSLLDSVWIDVAHRVGAAGDDVAVAPQLQLLDTIENCPRLQFVRGLPEEQAHVRQGAKLALTFFKTASHLLATVWRCRAPPQLG